MEVLVLEKILVINTGSTSTKLALFSGRDRIYEETLRHNAAELANYERIIDQLAFRSRLIVDWMQAKGIKIKDLAAVAARGGLVKPIPSGTYRVNEAMLQDLGCSTFGEHASNLGALLAHVLTRETNIPAFVVDPVVVDEMQEVARLTGHPDLERRSIFHALNQKAVGRRAARDLGKAYEEVNLVVAHLGGGISVAAHECGKVIDVNNALNGEGPFTPERSGTLPAGQLVELCFSGRYSKREIMAMLKGKGGVMAFLGTNDMQEVERRLEAGDGEAATVFAAMAYQISKEIGAQVAVLCGKVDAVVITGGIAHSQAMITAITKRVERFGPILVYPGEDEMLALAEGAVRVLVGEDSVREYQ
ncbi:MAG TPA: butyrate kinase [Firmicutes bacterium]|jgi:butyrate kinase|nr:butyrate kinase [Bacillota bacterium]